MGVDLNEFESIRAGLIQEGEILEQTRDHQERQEIIARLNVLHEKLQAFNRKAESERTK